MSIAEKLTLIAENQQKVHDAGVAAGASQGGDGGAWQYVTALNNAFNAAIFPEGTELTIQVPRLKNDLSYAFYETAGLKKLTLAGNAGNNRLTFTYTFRDSELEEIDLTGLGTTGSVRVGNFKGLFYNARNLHTIHGVLDLSEMTDATTPFNSCTALTEIRFKENSIFKSLSFASCSLLSDASVRSILDGLADLTDLEGQTLTLRANVGAKLTDAQKAAVAAKNWTLTY